MRRAREQRGAFVALEGIDGSGTTTQAQRLAQALRAEGWPVRVTCEPSEGPVGGLLRQALAGRVGLPGDAGPLSSRTLALLFAADRTDHLDALVLPALARGEIVLTDRYLLSSLAYQGSALPMRWVEELNAFAVRPDLTLFIEVSAAVAARRRALRGGAEELFDADDAQRRIARAYRAAIRRRRTRERIVCLDGTAPPEEVTARALEAIRKVLPAAGRRAKEE